MRKAKKKTEGISGWIGKGADSGLARVKQGRMRLHAALFVRRRETKSDQIGGAMVTSTRMSVVARTP
jgi:hypothetical protein